MPAEKALPTQPIPGFYIERIIVLPDKGEIQFMSVKSPLSNPMWTGTARRMTANPFVVPWPDIQ